MVAKYVFKKFTDESFAATSASWRKKTSTEISFPTESEQILCWAATRLDLKDQNDSIAFGIFDDGVQEAAAICEVVIRRKSARSHWVKMLKVRLGPELEAQAIAGATTLESAQNLLLVYAAAINGVMRLKFEQKATILKIYGRSYEQVSFLKLLGVELEKRMKNHNISIHGQWLVIENSV